MLFSIYNADPNDAHQFNDTIEKCTACWSMGKSGRLIEPVEKKVQFRTSEVDWDSLDDDTIEIMNKLEAKKGERRLGVFAKCNAPDTAETGRRAIRKVRARIENVKLRN